MGILVLVEAIAKPECVDEFVRLLAAGLPQTREADGCNEITGYHEDDGQTFVFVEKWDSKEQYLKYLEWRTETGVMDALGALLQAPPSIRFFTAVDV